MFPARGLERGPGSRDDSSIEVCWENTEGNCTGARGGAAGMSEMRWEALVAGDGVGWEMGWRAGAGGV